MSCGCQLMMVVGIVILCWITVVVGSRSFIASHRRSNGLLYPRPTKLEGGILDSPCPSVYLSVRLSVDNMVFGA